MKSVPSYIRTRIDEKPNNIYLNNILVKNCIGELQVNVKMSFILKTLYP